MSEGPIKRERNAHKPVIVSTPSNKRVCARGGIDPEPGRGYCGRHGVKLADSWSKVTCTDCRAAHRADGGKIELLPAGRRA